MVVGVLAMLDGCGDDNSDNSGVVTGTESSGDSESATVDSGTGTSSPWDSGDTATGENCADPFEVSPTVEDTFDIGWSESQTLWRRASWMQNGTQMSAERCAENADGFLEQTVLAGEPFSGGSMQSRSEYGYGRWVARLKPSSVPGALNSMFTMDWDDMTTAETDGDGSHEEIDIEFLTYTFGAKSGSVHFAVHAPPLSNYFVDDVALDFNPSDEFHEWGFDVLPDRIVWHVDGNELATFIYDDTVTITGLYELFFNSWTKESWINGPPSENAVYQIDWVRFYPFRDDCR